MASRASDWWRQAQRDLAHARNAMEDSDFEWSCFAAQQAAEKAIKAVFQHLHQEAWGHVVHQLLESLPDELAVTDELVDRGRRLDRHYVPTRYPNGFASGAPGDFYTADDAGRAIEDAEAILEFCAHHLA
jgi:HEPN domain-containing protein